MKDFLVEIFKEIIKQLKSDLPTVAHFLDKTIGKFLNETIVDWLTSFFNVLLFPEVYLFLASSLVWKMLSSILITGIVVGLILIVDKLIEKKSGKEKAAKLERNLPWVLFVPIILYGIKGVVYAALLLKTGL